MAEDTQTEEEPSIEEILDSIRQIISEDDDEEGEEAVDTPEPAEEPEEAVPDVPLDQSAVDEIDFDSPVVAEEPEPIPEPEPEPTPEPEPEEDVLELVDRVDETDEMDVDLRDEEVSEPEPAPVEESDIFTSKAETAAVGAITQLVKKTAVERGGVTLEEIVRSELKPMLRDWLDNNLPTLIERLVSEELERVSNRLLED